MNPAITQHTSMPPALVDAITEDPSLIQPIARAMGAVNLDNLFQLVSHPDASITQKMEFQRLVNKLGRLDPEPQAAAQGSGFVFNINLGGGQNLSIAGTPQQPALEGVSEVVEDD